MVNQSPLTISFSHQSSHTPFFQVLSMLSAWNVFSPSICLDGSYGSIRGLPWPPHPTHVPPKQLSFIKSKTFLSLHLSQNLITRLHVWCLFLQQTVSSMRAGTTSVFLPFKSVFLLVQKLQEKGTDNSKENKEYEADYFRNNWLLEIKRNLTSLIRKCKLKLK